MRSTHLAAFPGSIEDQGAIPPELHRKPQRNETGTWVVEVLTTLRRAYCNIAAQIVRIDWRTENDWGNTYELHLVETHEVRFSRHEKGMVTASTEDEIRALRLLLLDVEEYIRHLREHERAAYARDEKPGRMPWPPGDVGPPPVATIV